MSMPPLRKWQMNVTRGGMLRTIDVSFEPVEILPIDEMCPDCSTWGMYQLAAAIECDGVLRLLVKRRCGGCTARATN